ncbi:MAG: DUF1080 domain-containing protein [Pirellulaceae bacterium]
MTRTYRMLAVALTIALLPGLLVADEKRKSGTTKGGKAISLFDGKSLEGWDYHLVEPGVKMEDVWRVEDGVLICKGEPLGYICTKQKFKNFKLTLQWRWARGTEPGNSGVLLRATGEPKAFMLKCVEAQLKGGSAGDIWGFLGFQCAGDPERFREIKDHEVLGNFMGVGVMKNAEKEPGQWNTCRIVLQDDQLTIFINGEKVNEATGCDVVPGTIALQSEGGEIHFRKIKLVPLDG